MNLLHLLYMHETLGQGQRLVIQIGIEYFNILRVFETDDQWFVVTTHPTNPVIELGQLKSETIFRQWPLF